MTSHLIKKEDQEPFESFPFWFNSYS